MPLDKSIRKVLVIGSGPIVIGQAAEFDYAGTQACRALKKNGIEIVLVNSNPATIMTDGVMADKIYIEPLTLETVKRIADIEKPDSILSGLGGQTGLTLSMQLAKDGFLESRGIRLLGASPETIDKAEDRQLFKDTMTAIGQPSIPSKVVTDAESALQFAREIGYPVIVRPAFTLGGTGGGIAHDADELTEIARTGIQLSPIAQILVEKCVSGWKEIEFEVMRDGAGNAITVCSMENLDPVGVHTGDSIVIAPAVTLGDAEFGMLRSAALDIVEALGVEGGCNVQFALNPDSLEYGVIEVNPRVSRSSALASKATGYPIASVATQVAIGYRLDEIVNAVTGKTWAAFEPTIDYVAVKFPKWPFDKFVYAKRELGTQMKATGEVMSIADTFEGALMKAVRGAEIGLKTLDLPRLAGLSADELRKELREVTDERLFVVYAALKRGVGVDEIYAATKIDRWFLYKLQNLIDFENALTPESFGKLYSRGKRLGYLDETLAKIVTSKRPEGEARAASSAGIIGGMTPNYKMVDTCAGEFSASTPYFYAAFDEPESGGENEALEFAGKSGKPVVLVLGSGPIRIGQGIEFDYASVHCVWALKKLGYEVVIVNNNPETVSTDFDTADRLYFEPLTPEDVMHIIRLEKPVGVVAAFGGQTAIKLTNFLHSQGVNILGTGADSIDLAEDRRRFDALLESLNIKRPRGRTVFTESEALDAAAELGYPVLLRPSYVLGGQNMIIAFSDADIREYMAIILRPGIDSPVLIDQYLMGAECEVDAICDGEEILIPGIMEHIERAGVHSGDSIAVYPPQSVSGALVSQIIDHSRSLALALGTRGLVNIQYVVFGGEIYVIEVNPRASRTIPYLSKVTGVPMVELATRAAVGEKLKDMGYDTGLYGVPPYVAVKAPVFSFEKLPKLDIQLGPEMKSTGEVLGLGKTLDEALYKALLAAGYNMNKSGGVLISVKDADKPEIAQLARLFADMGFALYATRGTADYLARAGLPVSMVYKIHESRGGEETLYESVKVLDTNTEALLQSGKVSYMISTSSKGRDPAIDGIRLLRAGVERAIPCLTSTDTARALARCLMGRYTPASTELVNINNMRKEKMKLSFAKMQGCGNDYIYFDCRENPLISPESLSVSLSDRHFGIGGDGIVMILPSASADAGMRLYNLDGSEGAIGGNALRCVGKYLYDKGIVKRERMTIETVIGVRNLTLYPQNGTVDSATVDMGKAELSPAKIPVDLGGERVVGRKVSVAGGEYEITCVSMGNPHCVVFVDHPESLHLSRLGPLFENDKLFPERVNTEFACVLSPNTITMRVWERGSGETLACGTGACAAVVAAVENGCCAKGSDIIVKVRGGELVVRYTDETVLMTGEAKLVFEGSVEI
ncbi:MAG: carbamoyl-phosphate synthase large subunit [Oscillospiraceae bacterium]|jgi:carbamoyl-phosphate synthase large subunit|nr:carbamoyl-phosphate synthase large subunit [Oscillospiraceae bacterium]